MNVPDRSGAEIQVRVSVLEAHQDQLRTASLLINVVEYINLMKKQGMH